MNDFVFCAPTKVFFGKDTHKQAGSIVAGYGFKKIMLHFGGGSVKRNGVYDAVMDSLTSAGIEVVELGGVEPNPKMSLVRRGIALARETGVQLILALGGGSVIDSAKAIAVGTANEEDPALFFAKVAEPKAALPVGTILTLSAAGSEMSNSCVITNDETWEKRGLGSDFHRPLFSIMNPELTYTVDRWQTGCGIVDIMMHTLERYLTKESEMALTDRIAESILKTVVEYGKIAIDNPRDYEARAQLMWAGSLSHNGLTALGRDYFMCCHQIEHEISGMFDRVSHGAGLAVVFPAWCKFAYKHNIHRFAQYAVNVWNCEMNFADPEKTALAGIKATEDFFASIGMPTRLSQLDIPAESIEELAWNTTFKGKRTLPGYGEYGKDEIVEILKLAL